VGTILLTFLTIETTIGLNPLTVLWTARVIQMPMGFGTEAIDEGIEDPPIILTLLLKTGGCFRADGSGG
jgi:hypothetical protein